MKPFIEINKHLTSTPLPIASTFCIDLISALNLAENRGEITISSITDLSEYLKDKVRLHEEQIVFIFNALKDVPSNYTNELSVYVENNKDNLSQAISDLLLYKSQWEQLNSDGPPEEQSEGDIFEAGIEIADNCLQILSQKSYDVHKKPQLDQTKRETMLFLSEIYVSLGEIDLIESEENNEQDERETFFKVPTVNQKTLENNITSCIDILSKELKKLHEDSLQHVSRSLELLDAKINLLEANLECVTLQSNLDHYAYTIDRFNDEIKKFYDTYENIYSSDNENLSIPLDYFGLIQETFAKYSIKKHITTQIRKIDTYFLELHMDDGELDEYTFEIFELITDSMSYIESILNHDSSEDLLKEGEQFYYDEYIQLSKIHSSLFYKENSNRRSNIQKLQTKLKQYTDLNTSEENNRGYHVEDLAHLIFVIVGNHGINLQQESSCKVLSLGKPTK